MLKRLKLPKIFIGVARTFPTQAYGCRKRGRNLKIAVKNAVFLILFSEKQYSPRLAPRRKPLGKSTGDPPPGKYLPTPLHTSVTLFCEKLCCVAKLHTTWLLCSITPMQLAIHSRVTDRALCILPNNYSIVSNHK